jgi:hypothetical protein
LKPAWANSLQDPILKKPITPKKKVLVEWLMVYAQSSSPSTAKKKKKPKRLYTVVVYQNTFYDIEN